MTGSYWRDVIGTDPAIELTNQYPTEESTTLSTGDRWLQFRKRDYGQ